MERSSRVEGVLRRFNFYADPSAIVGRSWDFGRVRGIGQPLLRRLMDIRIGAKLIGPDGAEIIVDRLLGQGGFGQVFAGTMPDGTTVAIKTVLTSLLDADELKALQNEAKLAKDIEHPNVVRILHVNTGENEAGIPPYMVMELVDGGTLRSIIDAHRKTDSAPTVEELRSTYLQIAEGMQAINANLIHRDLKPDNILVDAETGQLKIADFGLAKLADAATRSETFKGWGTRPYQAPEAFEQGPNTVAMDIYAAGVTFFELAGLRFPIQPKAGDDGPMAWRNAHLLTPPLNLRDVRSDVPDSLVQLVALMLEKDPKRRPQTWEVVIERLRKEEVPTEGKLDVSLLIQKATTTFLEKVARESKERDEREKLAERNALLRQAIQEPINMLKEIVETFNEANDAAKLALAERDGSFVEVTGPAGGKSLIFQARIISDLQAGPNAIYRVIAIARINPNPPPPNRPELFYVQTSFGSFNLGYKVNRVEDRFGMWNMLRFESNPIMAQSVYPHWFAMEFDELPQQLQVLSAMGKYQNQQRPLDHEWFSSLLLHLL